MSECKAPRQRRRRRLAAPLALPAGFGALLIVGAAAAGTHGAVSAGWVLGLAAAIVLAVSAVAEPSVAPLLGVIGWLTVIGFSRPPYAQLRLAGSHAGLAALVIGCCVLAGVGAGVVVRWLASSVTLWIVDVPGERPADNLPGRPVDGPPGDPAGALPAGPATGPGSGAAPVRPAANRRIPDLTGGIGVRRLVAAGTLLAAGLPLLTLALSVGGLHLDLGDDLLVYLVAVVAVAVIGGFWPAVFAAVIASLLVNWYFTPPVHTLTIADGKSLLALLLFVTVAVTVSSVVHLAAHRARQAARSTEEAQDLLALAQTVLGGADTPTALLDHLTASRGGRAELLEQVRGQWVKIASSGSAVDGDAELQAHARADLVLVLAGQTRPVTKRLLDGLAAQAAAAQRSEERRVGKECRSRWSPYH